MFIVEDGTGIADANSYVSIQWADDYFTDRGGNSTWAAALIAASRCLVRLLTT